MQSAAEVVFTAPARLADAPGKDITVRPGSAGWRAWWRSWRNGVRPPSAADWQEANDRLRDAGADILRLETELAVARAARSAAEREVGILTAVVVRNQERVEAESATASAAREEALAKSIGLRKLRVGGDD